MPIEHTTPTYHIGTQLRKLRLLAYLTQAELAERVGLSMCHIGSIETGRRNASHKQVLKLAEALQVSVEKLCE